MPIIIGISLLIQVLMVAHAVKTGRNMWIYVIMLAPGLGSLVYFVAEVLPDLRHSPSVQQTAADIAKGIDPSRELRLLRQQLELLDTVENRQLLARECMNVGLYPEAVELFNRCLSGRYANDPDILLELATAHFAANEHAEANEVFLRRRRASPHARSADGDLLYARTLEALGDIKGALTGYGAVAAYYPGEEATCRYALCLKMTGQIDHAKKLFEGILLRAKSRPRNRRRSQQTWVDVARANLQ